MSSPCTKRSNDDSDVRAVIKRSKTKKSSSSKHCDASVSKTERKRPHSESSIEKSPSSSPEPVKEQCSVSNGERSYPEGFSSMSPEPVEPYSNAPSPKRLKLDLFAFKTPEKPASKKPSFKCTDVDIFPREISKHVPHLTEYPVFQSLIAGAKVFCLYMIPGNKIRFQKKVMIDKYAQSFPVLGKHTKTCQMLRPNEIKWSTVKNKFKKPPNDANRTNADQRLGYKIDNSYLVKSYFTFGQKTVTRDTEHVIQTLEVPLLFYYRPPNSRLKLRDTLFDVNNLHLYDRFILESHSAYRIPSETTYLLFAVQKTYFSLHLIQKSAALRFETKNPLVERVTKVDNMYDVPVQTPLIPSIDDEVENDQAQSDRQMMSEFFQPPVEPSYNTQNITYYLIPNQCLENSSVSSEISMPVFTEESLNAQKEPAEDLENLVNSPASQNRISVSENSSKDDDESNQSPLCLERSVTLISVDFANQYGKLMWKPLDAPPKMNEKCPNVGNSKPLDLSSKNDNVIDEQILESVLENTEGNTLNADLDFIDLMLLDDTAVDSETVKEYMYELEN